MYPYTAQQVQKLIVFSVVTSKNDKTALNTDRPMKKSSLPVPT